jgi:transcriptional regulator with XRE-family HTH domain
MRKQPVMNRRYSPLSLAGHGTARTVLLRMAEDQDRATRIAELKDRHPRLTWAKIAEQVGVTERAATQWKKTGAMKPENAEALARVFNVDFDYIWSGPRPDTPEMFVDRRNAAVEPSEIAERLDRIDAALELAASERQQIAALLARQTELLEAMEAATRHAHDAADRLDESVAEAGRALRAAPPRPARAAAKPARKRSPKASGQDPA